MLLGIFLMKKETIQKFFSEFFLAAFSGILLTLPFPKAGLTQIAWVSFIPLFAVLESASPRKAFFLGG
jgi:apolipoprotein N-acyltransferase